MGAFLSEVQLTAWALLAQPPPLYRASCELHLSTRGGVKSPPRSRGSGPCVRAAGPSSFRAARAGPGCNTGELFMFVHLCGSVVVRGLEGTALCVWGDESCPGPYYGSFEGHMDRMLGVRGSCLRTGDAAREDIKKIKKISTLHFFPLTPPPRRPKHLHTCPTWNMTLLLDVHTSWSEKEVLLGVNICVWRHPSQHLFTPT